MTGTTPFAPQRPLQTAVLFLIFNRPDTTRQVFEAIRQARPPRLYVAADGARENKEGEAEKVAQVRKIATQVDWPCDVKTLFREKNLGCKHAVSGAITWFFEHEEMGIILEDDCLPNADFFHFCDELLLRYAQDEQVFVVTGNNFQNGKKRGNASYYFSKYNHCWGWATWKRAWQHYQGDLPFWPGQKNSHHWKLKFTDKIEQSYWRKIFNLVQANKIDSWAYPWTASVWYHGGLTATPNVNLVSNIGFGPDSTHTASPDSPLAGMKTDAIGKIIHPNNVVQDVEADIYVFDHAFGGRLMRFPYVLYSFPRRVVGRLYRMIKSKVPHA